MVRLRTIAFKIFICYFELADLFFSRGDITNMICFDKKIKIITDREIEMSPDLINQLLARLTK